MAKIVNMSLSDYVSENRGLREYDLENCEPVELKGLAAVLEGKVWTAANFEDRIGGAMWIDNHMTELAEDISHHLASETMHRALTRKDNDAETAANLVVYDELYATVYAKLLELDLHGEEDETFSADNKDRFLSRLRLLVQQYLNSYPHKCPATAWDGVYPSPISVLSQDLSFSDCRLANLALKYRFGDMVNADFYVAQMGLPLPFGKRCDEYEQRVANPDFDVGFRPELFPSTPKGYGCWAYKGEAHLRHAMEESKLSRAELRDRHTKLADMLYGKMYAKNKLLKKDPEIQALRRKLFGLARWEIPDDFEASDDEDEGESEGEEDDSG